MWILRAYLIVNKMLKKDGQNHFAAVWPTPQCQTGSGSSWCVDLLRQSGMAVVATALLLSVGARAQQPGFEIALRDGRVLYAELVLGEGEDWRITDAQGNVTKLKTSAVLSLHAGKVEPSRLPAAFLAGGEVVRGLLVGGDAGGDVLELQSPVLGRTALRVDRLLGLSLSGGDLGEFLLPDGSDEVLFQKVKLGFDRLTGTVHQFGEQGIRFQPDGQLEPRWFPVREVAALRFRAPEVAKFDATAELLTRAGDRLRVQWRGFRNGTLCVLLEDGRELLLNMSDLGCLQMLTGVTYVSALEPSEVSEAGPDSEMLLPWRRDQAVSGGALAVFGRAFGRGLGVHSRSRLVFVVPNGVDQFWTRVAFDDCALALPVRGAVVARVLVGDRVVFTAKDLRAGQPAYSTGLIPVRPAETISLEVDFGTGRDLGDRIDWLSPVFLTAGARH